MAADNIQVLVNGKVVFNEVITSIDTGFLASIVDSSNDAIISRDLDGIILTWNKAAETIFGYTTEEVVGKSINILTPPNRLHEETDIMERIRQGMRINHYQTVRNHKNGIPITVSISVSPVLDGKGKIVAAAKIIRDITEENNKQSEIDRAKDHLIGVLSHELRGPLTPALAAVHMLERIELPDQAKSHLDMIRRNLQAEARLINDLLEITRIASGKIQTKYDLTDMHRLIDGIITNSQPSLSNKRLSMSTQLDAPECHVWGDTTQLQQTLGNIMSNAIKFSNVGGQIIVATKNVNSKLQISITDTGAGIDPEFLTVMFTSFQQGDGRAVRRYGGLGFGLSISKSLIEMHDGTLTAHSDGIGKGACFTITLPTIPATTQPPRDRYKLAKDGVVQRILIVDDNVDTANALEIMLSGIEGYTIYKAGSVKESIGILEQNPIDLVISDIGLPDGSGTEIMEHVRGQGSNVPGIAISGYSSEDDIQNSKDAGFQMHLVKPMDMGQLEQQIKALTKPEQDKP